MSKETQNQLIADHFLVSVFRRQLGLCTLKSLQLKIWHTFNLQFKEGDRFLQEANACRYWPTGRGIYHNSKKTFLVWCVDCLEVESSTYN